MPKFDETKEPDIYTALTELGLHDYKYEGDDPVCESDFNEKFTKLFDDGNGFSVDCKDPSMYGVTYIEAMDMLIQLQEKYDRLQYREKRRQEYPKLTEQLDMLWHDMNEDRISGKENSKWFDCIKKIKDSYPV